MKRCSRTLIGLLIVISVALSLVLPVSVHAAEKVSISKKKITLTVGETYTVSLNNAAGAVKWKSGASGIAKVNKKTGVITAVAEGTCKITTKYNGKKYTCKVTVKAAPAKTDETSGKAGKMSAVLSFIKKGESVKLELTGAKVKGKWSSDDKSTATVDNGVVKGVDYGFARICVKDTLGVEYSSFVVVMADISPFEFKYHDKSLGEIEEIKHRESITYNIYKNGKAVYCGELSPDKLPRHFTEYDSKGKAVRRYIYDSKGRISRIALCSGNEDRVSFGYTDGAIDSGSMPMKGENSHRIIDFYANGVLERFSVGEDGNSYSASFYENGNLKQECRTSGQEETFADYYGNGELRNRSITVGEITVYDYYSDENGNIFIAEYDPKTGKPLWEESYNEDGSSVIWTYDAATGKAARAEGLESDGTKYTTVFDPETGREVSREKTVPDGTRTVESFDSEHTAPVMVSIYNAAGELVTQRRLIKEDEENAEYEQIFPKNDGEMPEEKDQSEKGQ